MQDLREIEAQILHLENKAAKSLLEIGKLLAKARAAFNTAKEFLAWAERAFNYKKAFVYRLMQAADSFADKPEFGGVAIRVLGIIAGLPEEQQEAAAKLAEAGELDSKAAKELQQEAKATERELESNDFEPAPIGLQAPAEPASNASETDTDTEIKLRLLIKELQEELNQIKAKPNKLRQDLPVLPQFKQQDLALRLGLNNKQAKDPKQIKEAFRTWVKLGYGKQHEAFNLIEEAKEALLSLI